MDTDAGTDPTVPSAQTLAEPTPEVSAPAGTPGFAICSSSASDPDGDGFGFENNESCIVDTDAGTDPTVPSAQTLAEPTPEVSAPAGTPGFAICSSSASDPDGDGFGFENNESCIVDTDAGTDPTVPSAQTLAEPTPEVSAPAGTPGFAICSSSASDPDGDGFGFENNESCIVDTDAGTDPTVPSVQTLAGPTPEISVPAGTPGFAICSSIDSDPDGDGFGFENNLTCIVDTDAGVDPATPLIQTPAEPTPDVSAAQTTEAGEESAPDALQQPQQSDLPIDSCAATTPNTSFNRTTDLIVLHFDFGRDPDDGHAAVADRVLLDHFAIQNYWVVSGTNSRWQNNFIDTSDTLMDSLFGQGGWQKANILNDNTWMQAIAASALRWSETLSNGGDLWIAEGGPADFTSAVLRSIESTVRDCNWEARIHVIQHSATNETNTGRLLDDQRTDDLAYVRANTDYHKIDDGNAPNGTADLHANNATTAQNSAFIDLALSGASRVEWQAGFQFLGPGTDSNAPVGNSGGKLDFSDTVELLHILQVPTTQVSDWNDFAREYF